MLLLLTDSDKRENTRKDRDFIDRLTFIGEVKYLSFYRTFFEASKAYLFFVESKISIAWMFALVAPSIPSLLLSTQIL